jgi:UDP-N-acetyl-2-amino-2-deoxyglucuronate dehydrogenase
MKNFALIGAAGYIAPRHLKAIKEIGGDLVAAYDISDSVGILDSYFPACHFFTDEFEFYNRLLDDLKADYMVICSPNYLHEEHCRNALKLGMDIICEKPLVLTLAELAELKEMEDLTEKNIYTILQLRLHPMIQQIKSEIENAENKKHQVAIEYFTPRGPWYHASWKGNIHKSGGIATNIGIHLFDLAAWLFGEVKDISIEKNTISESSGILHLEKAEVSWHLSILPETNATRRLIIDGKDYEFTEGFADLHTRSYELILNKEGFTTSDVKPSIDIVERIRKQ